MSEKLEPWFKKAWLRALRGRNGVEYVQARGDLVKEPGWELEEDRGTGDVPYWGFCCLGVGCDVLVRKGVEIVDGPLTFAKDYRGRWTWRYVKKDIFWDDLETSEIWLENGEWPEDVCRAVGLDMAAMDELVQMNDGGDTFAKIADWIEVNL
jgi:hypothetical protein